MTISVIVAAYNAAETLEDSIGSILRQSHGDLEILVIDDASTDETAAAAGRMADADSRIRVVRAARNGGPAAARNLGLDRARGEWVAIVDADDIILPGRFAAMLDAAKKHGADIVFDNLVEIKPGDTDGALHIPARHDVYGDLYLARYIESHRRGCPVPNMGYLQPLIRRACLEDGPVRYDASLPIGEDAMLVMTLMAKGAKAFLMPEAHYRYLRRPGSASAHQGMDSVRAINASYNRFLQRFGGRLPPGAASAMRQLIQDNEDRLAAADIADDLLRFRPGGLVRQPRLAKGVARELGSRIKARLRQARNG